MALYNLLDLAEPAYLLNGVLVPADDGPTEIVQADGRVFSLPAEFRRPLRYFTRLRLRSETLAPDSDSGVDADDLNAMVRAGILWHLRPGSATDIARQLSPLRLHVRAPLAAEQNRPGLIVLDLGGGAACLISDAGRVLLERTPGRELGDVVGDEIRVTAAQPAAVWRRVAADLTRLLRTGAAAATAKAL